MIELHLLKVPDDPEAKYAALLKMFRSMTKREPTLADTNVLRADVGLPLLPEEGSHDTLTE